MNVRNQVNFGQYKISGLNKLSAETRAGLSQALETMSGATKDVMIMVKADVTKMIPTNQETVTITLGHLPASELLKQGGYNLGVIMRFLIDLRTKFAQPTMPSKVLKYNQLTPLNKVKKWTPSRANIIGDIEKECSSAIKGLLKNFF